MHILDGFIPLWQCAIYGIIMLVAWIFTLKWVIETLIKWDKEKPSDWKIITYLFLIAFILPMFVFTIQAFNIPVPFGTGISLLGAALVAIILRNPWGGGGLNHVTSDYRPEFNLWRWRIIYFRSEYS